MHMSRQTTREELDANSWVESYGDILYRFAIARVGRADLAEDLVQETFVAAWKAREQYRGHSSRQTWLIAILKRKLSDHFRRKKSRKNSSQVDWVDHLFDAKQQWKTPPSTWGDQPDEEMMKDEFWQTFEACLKKLPRAMAVCFEERELH